MISAEEARKLSVKHKISIEELERDIRDLATMGEFQIIIPESHILPDKIKNILENSGYNIEKTDFGTVISWFNA